MKQVSNAKAWHVLDFQKSKYFLVDIIPQTAKSNKTTVQLHNQKFQVPNDELLQYDPEKNGKIYQLRFVNNPEILDWIKVNGGEEGWVKLNSRVALDFDHHSEDKRLEHIDYLLGRFLVSFKKLQYICVANDSLSETNRQTAHQTIITAIANKTKLWPYAVPLETLGKLYNAFFSGVAIKFKIFIKETSIIKLEMTPYLLSSKDLFCSSSFQSGLILNLNPFIFDILAGSSREIKNYFKIPERAKKNSIDFDASKLVDCLMSLGLKVTEINKIISLFTIIMNINQAEMFRSKKEGKTFFRIREKGLIKSNLESLLQLRLYNLLESDLNKFKEETEQTIENIVIKQIILMRLLWSQSLRYVSQLMNSKLVNLSVNFTPDIRKLIFIQFPPTCQKYQESPENYFLSKINQFIKEVALQLPLTSKPQNIDLQDTDNILNKIKQEHSYDFNKHILNSLEKENKYQSQLKEGAFMRTFIEEKLNIQSSEYQLKKSKTANFLDEISQLQHQDDSRYANFIVRSQLNSNLQPSQEILSQLKASIEEKYRKERQALEQKMQKQFIDYENDKNRPPQHDEDEWIEVKATTFDERYKYCQLVKKIYKSKLSSFDWMENYFNINHTLGKVKLADQEEVICLSQGLFRLLQRERMVQESKADQIKRQYQRWHYRRDVFHGLHCLYIKIKLYKWLCLRIYSPMRDAMKATRKRAAVHKVQTGLNQYCNNLRKLSLKEVSKRAALELIQNIDTQIEPKSILSLKKQFMQQLKAIRKRQRQIESMQKFSLFEDKKMLKYQYQLLSQLKLIKKTQIKQEAASVIFQNVLFLHEKTITEGFSNIAKQSHKQITHVAIKDSHPNSPSHQDRSEPVILINEPAPHTESSNIQHHKPPSPHNQANKQRKDSKFLNRSDFDSHSNAPSSIQGAQQSEIIVPITKDELLSIKDCPKFSFESWCKQAVGFQKKKPEQPEKKQPVQKLFNKSNIQRPVNKQPEQQLNVDILIKQKVVVNPFFPFLLEHIEAGSEEKLQQLLSHQYRVINEPLLKKYPLKHFPNAPQEIFNNLLKIGKDKNTTRSKQELINSIVKPIKDSYFLEKKSISNVFEGEPALIIDYSWEHNIIKDEVFLQFIKQIMMNEKEESLRELFFALQVISRYYYPSPQFLYAYLHYLKSLQSKNIHLLTECFINTLMFAQAYERYKGNNVTVLEQQIIPNEKESYHRLQSRITEVSGKQIYYHLTISLRLVNEEKFEFKVRNQDLSHFKRKLLKNIDFSEYEDYFGVFYAKKKDSSMIMMNQHMKAVDFLNQYSQNDNENILYVKLKCYFPFILKELNKTRIMYLNSIAEERTLPWNKETYEQIVALAMMFDEFQEYRISNYLKITNQTTQQNIDLSAIQTIYKEINSGRGQKNSEIQYFKVVKESNFVVAKGYKMKEGIPEARIASTIVIKPLELCLYEGSEMKCSINLKRIRSYFFEKGEIYLEIDYKGVNNGGMRSITLKGVERANELFQDITTYIGYLSDFNLEGL